MTLPNINHFARYALVDTQRLEERTQGMEREAARLSADGDAQRFEDFFEVLIHMLHAEVMATLRVLWTGKRR